MGIFAIRRKQRRMIWVIDKDNDGNRIRRFVSKCYPKMGQNL
jgi:hypothetical protein